MAQTDGEPWHWEIVIVPNAPPPPPSIPSPALPPDAPNALAHWFQGSALPFLLAISVLLGIVVALSAPFYIRQRCAERSADGHVPLVDEESQQSATEARGAKAAAPGAAPGAADAAEEASPPEPFEVVLLRRHGEDLGIAIGADDDNHIVVAGIHPGTVAEKYGDAIQELDRILEINGVAVTPDTDFFALLQPDVLEVRLLLLPQDDGDDEAPDAEAAPLPSAKGGKLAPAAAAPAPSSGAPAATPAAAPAAATAAAGAPAPGPEAEHALLLPSSSSSSASPPPPPPLPPPPPPALWRCALPVWWCMAHAVSWSAGSWPPGEPLWKVLWNSLARRTAACVEALRASLSTALAALRELVAPCGGACVAAAAHAPASADLEAPTQLPPSLHLLRLPSLPGFGSILAPSARSISADEAVATLKAPLEGLERELRLARAEVAEQAALSRRFDLELTAQRQRVLLDETALDNKTELERQLNEQIATCLVGRPAHVPRARAPQCSPAMPAALLARPASVHMARGSALPWPLAPPCPLAALSPPSPHRRLAPAPPRQRLAAASPPPRRRLAAPPCTAPRTALTALSPTLGLPSATLSTPSPLARRSATSSSSPRCSARALARPARPSARGFRWSVIGRRRRWRTSPRSGRQRWRWCRRRRRRSRSCSRS